MILSNLPKVIPAAFALASVISICLLRVLKPCPIPLNSVVAVTVAKASAFNTSF
jgi:hypothetical protein